MLLFYNSTVNKDSWSKQNCQKFRNEVAAARFEPTTPGRQSNTLAMQIYTNFHDNDTDLKCGMSGELSLFVLVIHQPLFDSN